MKRITIYFILFNFLNLFGQTSQIEVKSIANGFQLTVDNKPFFINGMNWDYVPIGTNALNGFWDKSDSYIKSALDSEMALLKNMGVNTLRMYTGMNPKWIQYIYENYGIYTMLNHTFGAYGVTINGAWYSNTEYRDEKVRDYLINEAITMANQYRGTPGLLIYMLGNENNYHISWGGAETEDIPIDNESSTIKKRARAMYSLFNEAALAIKNKDQNVPVAICNGDLLYLDIVADECKDIDIYGTNMYRGVSFSDAFDRVKKELNKPLLFAEFGSDAFNARENKEDQYSQAYYMVGNWEEIYKNAAGLGLAENSIGGFTFQFSDGWWKYGFNDRKNAEVHDNNASWPNGGYANDYVKGENNMNEEWFGVCAKGLTNTQGLYTLYPRASYYALKQAHKLNPYAENQSVIEIDSYFNTINLTDAVLRARGDKAAMGGGSSNVLSISKLRAEFTTFSTGGKLLTTPDSPVEGSNVYPSHQGFDHMQSFYVGVEGKPAANMRANVEFNILGNVADNPIDEIFYENRGRPIEVTNLNNERVVLNDPNRLTVYGAEFDWNHKFFDLKGFYRTGHYHWGYQGDFFNLYSEANYGPNLDIYNGNAPLGVEIEGKKWLSGLSVAFGPELWWGANPAILLKYTKSFGGFKFTGLFHEDLADPGNAITSVAIPQPRTRRTTLAIERKFGKFGFQLGGIWGGQPLVGRPFQNIGGGPGNYTVYEDTVKDSDTWGGKVKFTFESGRFNAYIQAASQGLVANGGADATQTFTGWKLKDSGSGNQNNFLAGFTLAFGDFQFAPNFLWQKPLVDPVPGDVGGTGRLRNILQDPFVVRPNRETTAGEFLITYDPTPASWFYQWDNDRSEDAKFAMNAGFVYRNHKTSQDAAIGFNANRNPFVFEGAPPAQDLWEFHSRIVSKISPEMGLIANLYSGNAQSNGSDTRLIHRFGGDLRMIYKNIKMVYALKVDDWGPFDYHRDFNITFPLQLMLDFSTTLGKPDWFILPNTQIGIRGTWRSLNEFSGGRYSPLSAEEFSDPTISPVGFPNGNEWEIRTYIHINIGK